MHHPIFSEEFPKNSLRFTGENNSIHVLGSKIIVYCHLAQLYLFIFNSVPNIPKRVIVGGDFGKETYDDSELTEWLPARKSISRPEEPGNLGQAVIVPDSLKENATRRFTENYFNVVANELMPLDRTLKDFREPE